jgi:D-alanine-D-alanine ligase-like ATP-grasp enzyme
MPRSRSRSLVQLATSTRRHWRQSDAEAVLDRLDTSGLSARAFARSEGLNVQRLYRWQRVLGGRDAKRPSFVEVVGAAPARLDVVLRSGVVLRVPAGFDGETVRRLVEALDGRPSRC